MPTPRGKGLSGSADDSTPGWQERAKARIVENEAASRKRRNRKRAASIAMEVDIPLLGMLRMAADKRGMSSASYARRAVAAFIAKDLGLEFSEVTRYFAKPHIAGQVLKPSDPNSRHMKPGKTVDDGQGFGDWLVR